MNAADWHKRNKSLGMSGWEKWSTENSARDEMINHISECSKLTQKEYNTSDD